MIFFATTRRGYDEYKALNTPSALWVAANVPTDSELSRLRSEGRQATNFNLEIDPRDPEAIADAITTIREHHPGQTIWVES